MLDRTLASALSQGQDGPVTIGGWVETLRDQKRIQFIIIRDESGSVQVTYPRPADEDALADQVSALSHGSFVIIKGQLKHDERVKLGGSRDFARRARGCRGSIGRQPNRG